MWIWVCVAIIVISLAVHVLLGRRIWRAVRELNAEVRSLGVVAVNLELELGRIGSAPAVAGARRPRHGMQLDTRPRMGPFSLKESL